MIYYEPAQSGVGRRVVFGFSVVAITIWKSTMHNEPFLFHGASSRDSRGSLNFVNDFNLVGVKRFYQATNHQLDFVRAWQGHEKEGKYVYVATGSALVGAVKLGAQIPENHRTDFNSHQLSCHLPAKFVLSTKSPAILWIAPWYANGGINLEPDTNVIFFSTATLEESKANDFRFHTNHWDIWSNFSCKKA